MKMDAHSEPMGAYRGARRPRQREYNLPDTAAVEGQTRLPGAGARRERPGPRLGGGRGPASTRREAIRAGFPRAREPPETCPPSLDEAPERCDETTDGEGKGASSATGSRSPRTETGPSGSPWPGPTSDGENPRGPGRRPERALAEQRAVLEDPGAAGGQVLRAPRAARHGAGSPRRQASCRRASTGASRTSPTPYRLWIPGDQGDQLGRASTPSRGHAQPGALSGAGFPDYQWLFGTDGEYVAFASVAVGQFEPIKDHLRALQEVSEIDNGGSGKVVHEVVTDGTVFFGSDADDGNTDETAEFPSPVALIWRWTGDDAVPRRDVRLHQEEHRYIFRELDEDEDGWPEGLGNVEREGMGEEKLDSLSTPSVASTTWPIWRGARATSSDRRVGAGGPREDRLSEDARRSARESVTQYADSLATLIGAKGLPAALDRGYPNGGRTRGRRWKDCPGLPPPEHAKAALEERELDCYTDPLRHVPHRHRSHRGRGR